MKIHIDYVKRLSQYLEALYPRETPCWIGGIENTLNRLVDKWKLADLSLHPSSHFGLIINARSSLYGDTVVKMIPPFISRYTREKHSYTILASIYGSSLCKLYDWDDNASALCLERLVPGTIPDYCNDKMKILSFFRSLSIVEERFSVPDDVFPIYGTELEKKKFLLHVDYRPDCVSEHIIRAINLYEYYFSDSSHYFMHGDLHAYNLLIDKHCIKAIDPIGFYAPQAFEYVRFLGTELVEKQDINNILLEICISDFYEFMNADKLVAALYIDVAFRMHNTFSENNDRVLTMKWLSLLDKILQEYKLLFSY